MNIIENIREGLKSVNANLLRSILTALIVAIGITSLVGILTAIDGIEASIADSFSSMGADSFHIEAKRNRGRSRGVNSKNYPPIKYSEAVKFKEKYGYESEISISSYVTGSAEVKRLSKKTNPNVSVLGGNEHYMSLEGLDLEEGRNMSPLEVRYGSNVAIIGGEVKKSLFDTYENVLNNEISVWGTKYRVIGILSEQGAMDGGSSDRRIIVPIHSARSLAAGRTLQYNIDVAIDNSLDMEMAMGEARGIMRTVRFDRLGEEESFRIERSESLAEKLDEISGYLRTGGFGIGFITLLGASIGLMNIMMVSVTERTREIGIRKALGATPLLIRQQFLIEAIVVCQLGGLLGIILGIAMGNFISSIIGDGGTFVVPWLWMMAGFSICIVVGLGSGYYPAYKASKLDPIDALRFE